MPNHLNPPSSLSPLRALRLPASFPEELFSPAPRSRKSSKVPRFQPVRLPPIWICLPNVLCCFPPWWQRWMKSRTNTRFYHHEIIKGALIILHLHHHYRPTFTHLQQIDFGYRARSSNVHRQETAIILSFSTWQCIFLTVHQSDCFFFFLPWQMYVCNTYPHKTAEEWNTWLL